MNLVCKKKEIYGIESVFRRIFTGIGSIISVLLREAGSRMKIYFCDVCNESIPLQDIKDGVATTVGGKIYCASHNPLQAMQGITANKSTEKTSIVLFAIVIVLLMAVLAIMLWGQGNKDEEFATLSSQDKLRGDVGNVTERLNLLQPDVVALKVKSQEQETILTGIQTDIIQLRGDLAGVRGEVRNLSENLSTTSDLRTAVDGVALKLGEFNGRMSALENDYSGIRQRLNGYKADLDRLAQAGPVAVSPQATNSGEPAHKPATEKESKELKELKAKLTSKDNSVRFEAVNLVYDNRIKEALPYLLPLLEDPDQFVQVGAIQTVGEFLYLPAIPVLVKVLKDPDVTVREEALLQLIRMTGETGLNFDPRGSNSERDKAIKKWEDWLKKNS